MWREQRQIHSNHIKDKLVRTVEWVRLFSISEVMWDTRVMSSFIGVVWDIIRDDSQELTE